MNYKESKKQIIEAYVFLREKNNSISDEILDFIKDSALSKLDIIFSLHKEPSDFENIEKEKCSFCQNTTEFWLSDQTTPCCPECGVLQPDFEIGDKVYWTIGGATEKVFHMQGLFIQKNENGTSKVRVFQRNNQKLSAIMDIQSNLLQPHKNTPVEFGDLLQHN